MRFNILKNRKNNLQKKGTFTFDVALWIPRLSFTIILGIILLAVLNIYVQTDISVEEAEAEIFSQRILTQPSLISYKDPYTRRVYPGIIDIQRFNDIDFDSKLSYSKDNTYLGAKIQIYNTKKDLIAEKIFNEKAYRRIAEEGIRGKGGINVYEKDTAILIYAEGKLSNAIMHTSVVVSRS